MHAEGKLRNPDEADQIGPQWNRRRSNGGPTGVVAHATLARATRESEKPPEPEGPSDFSMRNAARVGATQSRRIIRGHPYSSHIRRYGTNHG